MRRTATRTDRDEEVEVRCQSNSFCYVLLFTSAVLWVFTLTNALTFFFVLQDVQRRASLGKAIIDLRQGLLLLVLIITRPDCTHKEHQELIIYYTYDKYYIFMHSSIHYWLLFVSGLCKSNWTHFLKICMRVGYGPRKSPLTFEVEAIKLVNIIARIALHFSTFLWIC